MTRQASLFDTPAPAPRQPEQAAPITRPTSWRAPTAGETPCGSCGAAACYAEGNAHWCWGCVPPGFLPHTRGAR